jgi:ABC-type sugar transport system substrate-binding protein
MNYRLISAISTAVAIAVLTAACGSSPSGASASGTPSGSSSTSAVSQQLADVIAEVNHLSQRPTSVGLTTPISGHAPSAKKIVILTCGAPICTTIANTAAPLAEALGWQLQQVSIGLTPQSVQAGWTQALQENPDGIIATGGYPREYFKAQLSAAKQRGIPVVQVFDTDPPSNGVISDLVGTVGDQMIGRDFADFAVGKTDGHLHALFINLNAPSTDIEWAAFEAEMHKTCSTCTARMYALSQAAQGAASAANQIVNTLQSGSSVNYLILCADTLEPGLPAALAGAGITNLPIISEGGSGPMLTDISNGKATADLAFPSYELMGRALDAFVRYFTHQPLTEDNNNASTPDWWLVKGNIPTATSSGFFPLVPSYLDQFKKLWNLG